MYYWHEDGISNCDSLFYPAMAITLSLGVPVPNLGLWVRLGKIQKLNMKTPNIVAPFELDLAKVPLMTFSTIISFLVALAKG